MYCGIVVLWWVEGVAVYGVEEERWALCVGLGSGRINSSLTEIQFDLITN